MAIRSQRMVSLLLLMVNVEHVHIYKSVWFSIQNYTNFKKGTCHQLPNCIDAGLLCVS